MSRVGDKRAIPQNGTTGIPAIGLTKNTLGKSQTHESSPQPRGIARTPWLECPFSAQSLLCPARRLGMSSSGGNAQTEVQEGVHTGMEDLVVLPSQSCMLAHEMAGMLGIPLILVISCRLSAYPTATHGDEL